MNAMRRTAPVFLAALLAQGAGGGPGPSARADEPKSTGWVESSKEEPAGTHYRTFASNAAGTDVSYLIYFPPGYDDDDSKRYPVVYWLHGMTADQREGAGFVRRLDQAIRDGHAPPMIGVLVNGRSHSYYCDSPDGRTPVESMIIKDLIPHIDSTYRTRDGREDRAVEGYSMGGFGAARLGFKYPETFRIISILNPAVDQIEEFAEQHPAVLREVFGGDKAYYEKNSPWTLAEDHADQLRDGMSIRLVTGHEDPLHGGSKDLHRRLEKLDIDHEYDVIDGVSHKPYEKLLDRLGDRAFAIYQEAWGDAKP